MKKFFLIMISLVLLLCFCACGNDDVVPSEADPDAGSLQPAGQVDLITVGTICNAAVVNIRIEPDENSRILDSALRGQMFRVNQAGASDQWQQIICRGETAYVSSEYLCLTQWETGSELTLGTVVNSDAVVQIYDKADPESKTVLGALKGEQYLVLYEDEEGSWYKLGFPEGEGFIPAEYLELRTTTIESALS